MLRVAPLLLVLGALSPVAMAGEEPVEGACDETGRIVCAGADAGGNVTCFFATPTAVQCDWTRGILWSGFSRLDLPGEVEGEAEGSLEVCLDQDCSTDTSPRALAVCSWAPAGQCVGSQTDGGSVGPLELAMGQCLKVTAGESLSVTARTINGAVTLREVSFANAGEGAGQECLVDDGRG